MKRTLYIATSNPGKLRDFAAAALHTDIEIAPLPNLAAITPPSEDQPTFEGNATLKAVYYSRFAPEETVIADDSGLEVDALGGAPGVRSARYAQDLRFEDPGCVAPHQTDQRNNLCLLAQLARAPSGRWQARYRCVLAAARNGVCLLTADGTVEGEILAAPRGAGGFGYDPLFYLPELRRTMAEISLADKDRLSHRGEALRKLLPQFARAGK